MTANNPVGSIWSKWDLHVHTPASIFQHYGKNDDATWELFLADIEQLPSELKVIGINDYIFVDGYERVLKAKNEQGRLKNIDLILPVIELRLDKFAGVVKKDADGNYSKSDWNRINLHVIFDQLDPEVIRQQFLSALVQCYQLVPDAEHLKSKWQAIITRTSLTQLGQMIIDAAPADKRGDYSGPLEEGFNNLCCSLDKILDTLKTHDLENRYLLAVGKAEWANMKWDDQSIAEKRNIINRVDFVFTAAENPEAYELARKKLTSSNVNSMLLDCSDAHALSTSENKDRIGNCFAWIKADPTFDGLRHAITEFKQRVFIGDMPPKRVLVANNRTKHASAVTVKKNPTSALTEPWFNVDVPLNHDLVAIIGNKGSGKSALADITALVGDTRNSASFSFLNEKRFRNPRTKLAAHFYGAIQWEDKTESKKALGENPDPSSVERVKYLPQSYLEALCNELAVTGSSTFDSELRQIIYTHVPKEDRIGFRSLDELLEFKVSELEAERRQMVGGVSRLNSEIASIERKLSPGFRASLEQQRAAKENELAALRSAKPAAVEDPLKSATAKAESAAATSRLSALEQALQDIAAQEALALKSKSDAVKRLAHINRAMQALGNHRKVHDQFLVELDSLLVEAGVDFKASTLARLAIDVKPLEELARELRQKIELQDGILSDQTDKGLLRRREAAEAEVKVIKGQLSEKQRLYLVYKEQMARWEKQVAEIVGDASKPESVEWYKAELDGLSGLPKRREQLRTERVTGVRRIHEQLGKIVEEYRTLYQPVQSFVQSAASMDMPLPLSFAVRIAEDGFIEGFLGRINRQTRGSFAGVEESAATVRNILQETDFMTPDAVVEFVQKLDDMLHFDRRPGSSNLIELSVSDQLRKGGKAEELYDYLFGLEYLSPRYSLTYSDQEISQLSPGERGLLLLVFYLLVDKDDIPLVIDQPEENLDNQTIYKILVTCIKAAKERRQVIMVTHNPNLAVVCDAEQIIYAACDKANKSLSYESGAIESPRMKARVIEILEGTKPAFVNRKQKYGY